MDSYRDMAERSHSILECSSAYASCARASNLAKIMGE